MLWSNVLGANTHLLFMLTNQIRCHMATLEFTLMLHDGTVVQY